MTPDPSAPITDRLRRLVAHLLGKPPRPALRPVPVVTRPGGNARGQRPIPQD